MGDGSPWPGLHPGTVNAAMYDKGRKEDLNEFKQTEYLGGGPELPKVWAGHRSELYETVLKLGLWHIFRYPCDCDSDRENAQKMPSGVIPRQN
jgi:hypothetical protein